MFDSLIAFHARTTPQKPAFETRAGGVDYAQFDADINRVASRLLMANVLAPRR